MDDVPVERVKKYQTDWTDFLTTRKAAVLRRIAREKALGADLTTELKAAAEQFKQTWNARPAAAE
jgi:F0F1-type ATP synthase alpha subunit